MADINSCVKVQKNNRHLFFILKSAVFIDVFISLISFEETTIPRAVLFLNEIFITEPAEIFLFEK